LWSTDYTYAVLLKMLNRTLLRALKRDKTVDQLGFADGCHSFKFILNQSCDKFKPHPQK